MFRRMPIHTVTLPNGSTGYQWGSHGAKYRERTDAERQAAAAHAHGYAGDENILSAAGILFVTPTGDALFLKRARGGDHVGEWCIPGGSTEIGESPEETARREAVEELGVSNDWSIDELSRLITDDVDFVTFLSPVSDQFEPQLNSEHVGYMWAPLSKPPAPLHPGVAKMLADDASQKAISERIKREVDRGHDPKQAAAIAYQQLGEDSKLAFDRASVRTFDVDGRLHIALNPISKACINEYYGMEIPDYLSLGLDPKRKYKLLRDPDELKKAAASFNNIQLLSKHQPVNASDPRARVRTRP